MKNVILHSVLTNQFHCRSSSLANRKLCLVRRIYINNQQASLSIDLGLSLSLRQLGRSDRQSVRKTRSNEIISFNYKYNLQRTFRVPIARGTIPSIRYVQLHNEYTLSVHRLLPMSDFYDTPDFLLSLSKILKFFGF